MAAAEDGGQQGPFFVRQQGIGERWLRSWVNLGSHPGSTTCWLCDLAQVTCLPVPQMLNCRMKIIPPTLNLTR